MNGNGMPVMGMRPKSMPMFSTIWNNHIAMIPAAMSEPNKSDDESPIPSAVKSSARYNTSNMNAPTKPNCSA